jgi:hypothetical protein
VSENTDIAIVRTDEYRLVQGIPYAASTVGVNAGDHPSRSRCGLSRETRPNRGISARSSRLCVRRRPLADVTSLTSRAAQRRPYSDDRRGLGSMRCLPRAVRSAAPKPSTGSGVKFIAPADAYLKVTTPVMVPTPMPSALAVPSSTP